MNIAQPSHDHRPRPCWRASSRWWARNTPSPNPGPRQEKYLIEGRNLYRGTSPAILRPGSVAEVAAHPAPRQRDRARRSCRKAAIPDSWAGRFRAGGELVLALTRARPHPRGRRDVKYHDLRGGAWWLAEKRSRRRPRLNRPVSALARCRGQLHHRRQPLDQCGPAPAALAYGVAARSRARPRSWLLADGARARRAQQAQEGQYGYGPAQPVYRCRRNARDHHGPPCLKLFPRPALGRDRPSIGVSSPARPRSNLLNIGPGNAPGGRRHHLRADQGGSQSKFRGQAWTLIAGTRLAGPHPWYVLLELSSSEPHGPARGARKTRLFAGGRRGWPHRRRGGRGKVSGQRKAFWRLRETSAGTSRKPEGGSIKHDVSVPLAHVPGVFWREADGRRRGTGPGRSAGCRSAHLGDGNIHYNITQPVGRRPRPTIWRAAGGDVNAAVACPWVKKIRRVDLGRARPSGRDEAQAAAREVKDPVALGP